MAKVDFRKLAARSGGRPAKLNVTVASGAGSASALAVPGITKADGLISVLDFSPPTSGRDAEMGADHVADTTVSSAGYITIGGTVATVGEQVLVFWYDLT